jgi:hypothetical protein
MNMARVKLVVIALALFLVVMQFVQPKRTNPPVIASRSLAAHVQIPPEVQSSLMRSCGDCHSNRTVWPWYSHVAPFSWVVTDDANEGRRHMNFDDWEAQETPQAANDHLADICKEIESKGMPPISYRWLHPNLGLKPEEIASVCTWSRSYQGHSVGGIGTQP